MKPETLLRLYPRAWRERYSDEVLAMVGREVTPAVALDMARGAFRERARFHCPMIAFLLLALGVLPGVALIAAGLSGLTTLTAHYLDSAFGVVPLAASKVRVIWILASLGTLIYCFRDRATWVSFVRMLGAVFVAAVLLKWLHNTWLHPFQFRDVDSWEASGRGDALLFGVLVLELWLRGAKSAFDSIDLVSRRRQSA